jgi:hypothetical protein
MTGHPSSLPNACRVATPWRICAVLGSGAPRFARASPARASGPGVAPHGCAAELAPDSLAAPGPGGIAQAAHSRGLSRDEGQRALWVGIIEGNPPFAVRLGCGQLSKQAQRLPACPGSHHEPRWVLDALGQANARSLHSTVQSCRVSPSAQHNAQARV